MQTFTSDTGYDDLYILLDADSLYFRCCMVTQKKHEIRKNINSMMSAIERSCNTFYDNVYTMVAVKGKGNFRNDIYDDYKGKRPEIEPHIKEALNYAHSYLVEKYDAVRCDGMEADDMVAIWAWECIKSGNNYVVSHIDKDLDMIPGMHYNFVKDTTYTVDFKQAHYNFLRQCLTGDNADNIPGVKGIGPKKSEKLLSDISFADMWNVVKSQWDNQEKLKLSARLLWMSTNNEEVESANELMLKRLSARTLDEFWLGSTENEDECESSNQTSECEQNVCKEGESDLQTEGVSGLPARDTRPDDGDGVEVQGPSS